MVKRLFDLTASLTALIVLLPVFALVAVGIKIASPGPVFYLAKRAGKDGKHFTMFKFRSMHVFSTKQTSAITGAFDNRIFTFGSLLRKTKIDELPQLINILAGHMSIVGPRPEDIGIVERHYSQSQLGTLKVLPGLASPGSLFNYTHGDALLIGDNPEKAYTEILLPIKLDLDIYYVEHQSFRYDVEIICRTIVTIVQILLGKKRFDYPREFLLERKKEREGLALANR